MVKRVSQRAGAALACVLSMVLAARAAEPTPAKAAVKAIPSPKADAAVKRDAAAKPADPYAWTPLFDGKTLANWKITPFGGEGEVKVRDGMVTMAIGNNLTGITYTGPMPRIDYELRLEGKRTSGSDFFATTTFPVGDKPCSLVTGGWGGTVVGLSSVDFYDASDNPTTKFVDFKNDQWYRFRIRVTKARIEAWIDGEKQVDQEVPGHRFSIRDEVDACQPLGICTWCTAGAVRGIELRQLRPEEAARIAKNADEDEK